MELNTVVSEIKGKVGIITLNRPKALNAVSRRNAAGTDQPNQSF
ncbi:MAG: hypothetical protein ACLSHR_11665 [Oscillospiraceae bacterium]